MPSIYGGQCMSHVLAQLRVGANVLALFPVRWDRSGYTKRDIKMRVIRVDRAKQEVQGVVLWANHECPLREGDEVTIPMMDIRQIALY